jgi:ubiquinone/menaquinone biosynthesis C-methylase UbiE
VADAQFAQPRLAEVYDHLDSDRSDLHLYVAIAEEFGVSTVLDLGCGSGTLACLLARRGKAVVGVDPAPASLEVARRKPGADAVRWLVGDTSTLPRLKMDMVLMTGNVAQVFLTDEEWVATLGALYRTLRPGGHLVFETRDPDKEIWHTWTREQTYKRVEIAGVGGLESWVDVIHTHLPLVSFRTTFVFASDGAVLTSESTLRFRDQVEITDSLLAAGFTVEEIRDAPDRPGLEMVFVAIRP